MEIRYIELEDDYWGRKRIQNVTNKHIYALVDGVWHSTTKDGEPCCPLKKDITFRHELKYQPNKSRTLTSNYVHLQSIGKVSAKPARDFKVGEFFAWNYGYQSEIVGIKKVTAKQIVFQTKTKDGEFYERRLGKDRLVAIGNGF